MNELQLLTEDMSNKENEQNDWSALLIILFYNFAYKLSFQKFQIEMFSTRIQITQIG